MNFSNDLLGKGADTRRYDVANPLFVVMKIMTLLYFV